MIDPTTAENAKMLDVLTVTRKWIDAMVVSGLEEKVVVSAIHVALVERCLVSGGVSATAEWLQSQADMAHALGGQLLDEIGRGEG